MKCKLFSLLPFILSLFISLPAFAAKGIFLLGGIPLKDYTIVYPSDKDDEESIQPATYLKKKLKSATRISLPIKERIVYRSSVNGEVRDGRIESEVSYVKSSKDEHEEIRILKSDTLPTFDYKVKIGQGGVSIYGGCGWALQHGIDILISLISENRQVYDTEFSGSIEGEILFPRPEGVNLRILDVNVWDYSQDSVPPAWQKAGMDCRDSVRAPKFAQLIRAYMPDIICLQEYSSHMDRQLYPLLMNYGYKRASNGKEESWPHTPIFYDKSLWKLVKVNYRLYGNGSDTWCNNGSKSFTSAVLKNKSTGKMVAVVSTHLWFRNDQLRPGSTYARTSQVALILAEMETIKAKFDCPIFVCGDMNSTERMLPIRLFLDAGYKPCYKVATQYADKQVGHHACFPHTVGSRSNNGKSRKEGSIDHCFIHNGGATEIKVFECLRPYFSVFLTDHYPNLIDATLK